MNEMLALGFGRRRLQLPEQKGWQVVVPPTFGATIPVRSAIAQALDTPVGAKPLASICKAGGCVLIVVSDETRADPRAALIEVIRSRLPDVRVRVAIATGTHGPAVVADLALPEGLEVINHDGYDSSACVELGDNLSRNSSAGESGCHRT